ncbi:MAG: Rnf-Nqr domain containing protein [Oscillospiraceae bacterium]|nr:Rnf-Nqr domain containing protein [Oscillospiraceae bacterium]
MSWFFQLLTAALYSLLIQNLIFSSGLALSETIRIARRPKFFLTYLVTIVYYSTVTSLVCSLLDLIEPIRALNTIWHVAVFAAVLAVIHIISSVFVIVVLKANRKFMNSMGMCAINSLILAVPIINSRSANTVFASVGSGIGAGLAFMLAVVFINSSMRRIAQNKDIPKAFRGMPAVFIYVALLSLAFTCLSGQASFI